ncbi:MAG TPA: Ig-like domain-containing protein, partial [Gemmatimonadaceae bacterium]|nr:Ig-like domain-containing protein [Gemmatimonadaceae bacterium]
MPRLFALAAVFALARGAVAQDTLRVLRHAPADTASPSSIITITFDRPIAGALDDSSDAARFVHVTPVIALAAHWRDPVTIRLIPREPLEPGREYVVAIDARVRGEDGSRLAAPYRFSFQVKGPRLVARNFSNYYEPEILAPEPRLQLLYSAPVDVARLESGTRIELSGCGDTSSIRLRVVEHRPVTRNDPYQFQAAAQYPRDTIAARFARLVELRPASPLPFDCDGKVVVPTTNDDAKFGREERYRVRTARTFRVTRLVCGGPWPCAPSDIGVVFSTSLPRANAERFIQLDGKPIVLSSPPGRPIPVAADSWSVRVDLRPRTAYTIRVDSSMEDIYGRRITGNREWRFETADFAPAIQYAHGNVIAASSGSHTFPVRSINTQFIRVIAQRVPDSVRFAMTASAGGGMMDWSRMLRGAAVETTTVELPDRLNVDTTTEVPLPRMALAPDHPLVVVRLEIARTLPEAIPPRDASDSHRFTLQRFNPATYLWTPDPLTVQVTDLAVTARLVGETEGSALVSSLTDGRPRAGVTVTQIDATGRPVARGITNDSGAAALRRIAADSMLPRRTNVTLTPAYPQVRVLYAQAGDDRVSFSLGGRAIGYTPENPLEPSSLGSHSDDGPLAAGAIFADRDIFRPKDVVHLKAVLRLGILGDLQLPSSRDSVRIVVKHRPTSWAEENAAVVRDTVLHLSEFGTAVDSLRLAASPRLGAYAAELQIVAHGEWRTIRNATFRVEEYRAPAFLVDLKTDDVTRFPGEYVTAVVSAHYLFGAPAAGMTVRWAAVAQFPARPMPASREFNEWTLGDSWRGGNAAPRRLSGTTTLDATGRATIRIPASELIAPFTRSVEITASVVDVDRQTVTAETQATVSGTRVFLFVRQTTAPQITGQPSRFELRTVDSIGNPVNDAAVRALVVRQNSRTLANGSTSTTTDTVRTGPIEMRGGAGSFSFVADSAGTYISTFTATSPRGDTIRTSAFIYIGSPVPRTLASNFPRWFSGQVSFHLPVTCEDKNLRPGSVAHVHFVSPFDDAEAWIKVEREGILEQRRQRTVRGDNVIDVPIVEKYAPNVIVSVTLLPRPNGAARPDSANERLRIGYVELPVAVDLKKLTVSLSPDRASYEPRDTASIRIVVRDAGGRGTRSEVALWAIDEGVLALTGFRTPDLLSLVYAPRGVGAPIWSTLPALLTNDPTLIAMFMRQSVMMLASAVVTGGAASERIRSSPNDITRSQFSSSAFYLGTVRTEANGETVARARVPDNLTTFRVMAVALSAGDKYGNGDTTILVTRPLVARAELPRFVRPSDSIVAGVAVTALDGRARDATAHAD